MDIRIRGISSKHNAKISIVDITESMQKIIELQGSNPLVTIALSKFTAANTLLAMELKNGEKMTANISTKDGKIGKMITEFQNDKIRSYAQHNNFDSREILKMENPIIGTVGTQGSLLISQDLNMRDPYVSNTDLVDGSIDLDFMNYLRSSNQVQSFITTKVSLNNDFTIKKVVGILVQLLPTHTENDIDYLEEKIGNSSYVGEILLKSTNYEALIKEIIEDAVILEQRQLQFECTCSKEKVMRSIKMLGQAEISNIIEEKKDVEIVCEFCSRKYLVNSNDISELLD
ncbi:molecular chaperone Hsp33 [Mesoplasma syrphidae]|uniref:Molecular chaperone Hsp33 n=1 Tax=Mesoplasma syrphidae TaxID=225999 RepID=A0A2K9BW06_9MOLU|nr:Hsp33 family molecular chaperone HslO [Mesoplasma syrphidae]AUF83900.1 molecular chaperone Hsp33 [Mesoplasma syrphidae]